MISPDSFLVLIFFFFLGGGGGGGGGGFTSVSINLSWTLLASNVSCFKSFLFLLALVLPFCFTNLLSSAYSTLSFNVSLLVATVLHLSYLKFQFLHLHHSF